MSVVNKVLGKVAAGVLAGTLALSSMGADNKTNSPSSLIVSNRVTALEQRASDNEAGLLNLARGLADAHNDFVKNYHAFTNSQVRINAGLKKLQLDYSDHFDKNLAVRVEQGKTNSAVDERLKMLEVLQDQSTSLRAKTSQEQDINRREVNSNIRGLFILQEKLGQNLTNYIDGGLAGLTNLNATSTATTNSGPHNYLGFSFPSSVLASTNLFPANYKGVSAVSTNATNFGGTNFAGVKTNVTSRVPTNSAKSSPVVSKGKTKSTRQPALDLTIHERMLILNGRLNTAMNLQSVTNAVKAETNSVSINTSNAPAISTNLNTIYAPVYDTNFSNIFSNFTARTEGQISNLNSVVDSRFGDLSNRLSLLREVVHDYTNNPPVIFANPFLYSIFPNISSNSVGTNLVGAETNVNVKPVSSTNAPTARTNISSKAKSGGKRNGLSAPSQKSSTNALMSPTNFPPAYIPMSPELTNQLYNLGRRVEDFDVRFTGFLSNQAVEVQARMDLLNRINSPAGATADLSDPRPVLGLAGVGNGRYFVITNQFTPNELPYALVDFSNHGEMLVPVLATNNFDGRPSQRLNVSGVKVDANRPNFTSFTLGNGTKPFYIFPKSPRAPGEPAAYIVPAEDARLNHNLTAVEAPGNIYALQPMRTSDFVEEQRRRELRKRN